MSSFSISQFLEKIESKDKDIRHMALYDLNNELQKETFKLDETSQKQASDAVLKTLDDSSSEVQGVAVKCLGPFVKKMSKVQVESCVTKLSTSILKGEDEKRDIATLALKTVISKIPAELATTTVKKCLETLIDAVEGKQQDVKQDALEVLNDILARFGGILNSYHERLQKAFVAELANKRPPVRKRATTCLATLSVHTVDKLFNELVHGVTDNLAKATAGEALRTFISTISAISRTAGQRLGKFLDKIVPLLWKAAEDISEKEGEDEVREYIMQAFESFVLRCPEEVKSHVEYILVLCREYIEYDPNFSYESGEEDDDDDQEGGDDEEGGDEEDVSDDDDVSWKVRTAAVKCLDALIRTRPEMLKTLYTELFNPDEMVLVKAFRERTESVKLEIFNTFIDLLNQTTTQTTTSSGEQIITPLAEISFIKDSKAIIIKKLKKQLRLRNSKIRMGVFKVLRKLVVSLQGGLAEFIPKLISPIKQVLSEKGDQNSALKLEVLSFLRLSIKLHPADVFVKHLDALSGSIYERVNDRYYKITAEALRVCLELVKVVAALRGTGNYNKSVEALYKNIYDRLIVQDIDQDVKESAISAMGSAISVLNDALKSKLSESLPVLLDRLKNEITRLTACKTFATIAESKVELPTNVLNGAIEELADYLKKFNRPLRQSALQTLRIFAKSYSSITPKQFNLVLQAINQNKLISDTDLFLAHLALELVAQVLESNPKTSGDVKDLIQPKIIELLGSSTLQGSALDSVLNVLKKLVPVVGFTSLFNVILDRVAASQNTSKQVFTNVGKSIASLCQSASDKETANTIAKFGKDLKNDNENAKLLALFTLGEIGRGSDLSANNQLVSDIEAFFDSGSEEIKNAASYSLGNISVGNLQKFLPHILSEIRANAKRKYLLIHSLKEVISQASSDKLKPFVSDSVSLLFENSENEEEGVRNVVAECLGKLALVDYATVMPKLKELLAQSELKKSAAISAVKFTITDQPRDIDAKLKGDIPSFLKLLGKAVTDSIIVRRAAVLLLNSAAHNKPGLIRDNLDKYLPSLYQECVFDKNLVKTIKLGPFNHKIDQGLELRKSAFECLDTILDSLRDRLDPSKFVLQIPLGLGDPNPDIKQLTHLMIQKLVGYFPEDLASQFSPLLAAIKETLTKKLKDNSVQQEKERHDELLRSTLKAYHYLTKVKGIEDCSEYTELKEKIIPNDNALKGMLSTIVSQVDAETTQE